MGDNSQRYLDNLIGLPMLWEQIINEIMSNRFDATYLVLDTKTGRLMAHQESNLKFSINSNGHLMNEVK